MSTKYKIYNQEGIYFITFSTVQWVDIFTRPIYVDILLESIQYCQKNKGLQVYAWVIMSNHVHMIISCKKGRLSDLIRDLKKFTSSKIVQAIEKNSYKERHLKVLQALAGFVAIALSNSNAHQSLVLANEKIAYMATHDPMTGLPNRMQIMDRLGQELKRCRRYKKALALMFIDLDGFKLINDTHGHRAGDSVLKEIAGRLSAGVRATDAVGRLAGDEFLVIVTDDCTPSDGLQLAEQIRESLSRIIMFEASSLRVTCSVGLAFYPVDGETPEELVNAADQAMYDAKTDGKNRTSLRSPQLMEK